MRHSGVNTTRPDDAVFDPIINDPIARAKPFGHLSDCQLLRPLEFRGRNPIAATDPLDNFRRVGQPFCADLSFPIELICNFVILQVASQFSDFGNHRGRIAHAVGYVERQFYREVTTDAALPPDVNQKLFLIGWLFDRDVLDQQSQHPLPVLGLCRGSMPQSRQIPGQSQNLGLLFGRGDVGFLTLEFRSFFLKVL